jgi:diguanylate cyclase (GGDEF)-like protein/PAS domain S-box-containing protein
MSEIKMIGLFLSLALAIGILCWYLVSLIRKSNQMTLQSLKENQRLSAYESRFQSVYDSAAIGIAFISTEGNCIKANASMSQLLDYSNHDLTKLNLKNFIHPEDYQRDLPTLLEMYAGKTKNFHSEQRWYKQNGQFIWVLTHLSLVRDENNQPFNLVLQIQDISEEKKVKQELQKLAYHDMLTGLANRHKFDEFLKQLLASAQRRKVKFAILMIDLDHFKNINDTEGHDTGDYLLQMIAGRLNNVVRSTDLIARLGGDEFVIVVTDINKLEEVIVVAQKVLSALLQPVIIKGHELYVTTSIGISVYPNDGEDMLTLLKNADLALYRAKDTGRNNYQFCTQEMTLRAHERMRKQQALNQALIRSEFNIFYQPKIDVEHKRINGVEALLRWQSTEFGSVSPDEIITLADETGLIVPLGLWILNTACHQVKIWQEAGFFPLTLAINLSARQFKQPDFINLVIKAIKESHFPAELLEFEITEKLILQDPENTLQILQNLKDIGVHIAIDDFGTGYSSLSYLKSFNVDKIKIDKTFIQRIELDETSRAIISAIIVMANKLGIKSIAEGVETRKQFEFLSNEKCSEIQGYFISQPMNAEMTQYFLQESARKGVILEQQ